MIIKYLSVCSGIEAATVAWHHLGWKPMAFSEIDPFPAAVLKHHYPNVANYGDMKKFQEWPDEAIDILVGGTPCQSFSIAGLRQGLKDPRGNLMLTYLAIAAYYRPRWIVWENVPGVLSSNGGGDFATFLGSLGHLGYGWAYRVMDAQWFGVPQRRRRVFVVGCLGDELSAAKVLFERESVCRNSAPSREKGKGIATNVAPSLTASNDPSRSPQSSEITQQVNAILEAQVAACLRSGGNGGVPSSRGEHLVVGSLDTECGAGKLTHQTIANGHIVIAKPQWWDGSDLAATITTSSDDQRMPDKASAQLVVQPMSYDMKQHHNPQPSGTAQLTTKNCSFVRGDTPLIQTIAIAFEPGIAGREGNESRFTQEVTSTLRKDMGDNQTAVAVAFHPTQDPISSENISHALGAGSKSGNATTAVAFESNRRDGARVYGDHTNTLQAFAGTGGGNSPMVQQSTAVRRLTPTECERLQGFPDGYTAISWRKKPVQDCPDGPRYKALGNSMAVPVMRWIGNRIDKVNRGKAL